MALERGLTHTKLIVLACQERLDTVEIRAFRDEVAKSMTDKRFEAITMAAYDQGVYPQFAKTVLAFASDLLDAEMKEALAFITQDIKHKNMVMQDELCHLIGSFEAMGIEVLSFKGPVLAEMLYGDVGDRQFRDLDLLIRKEDIDKVALFLFQEGYERSLPLSEVQERVWRKTKHDTGYSHPTKEVYLEVHWSLLDEQYPLKIDHDDLWRDQQSIDVNGCTIGTFATQDLLHYLLIHGSKHLWDKMVWLKDIDTLIRKEKIAWEVLIEKVEGSGFERMVYLGIALVSQLLQTPLPEVIRQRLSSCTQIEELKVNILSESGVHPYLGVFKRTGMMLKVFPDVKSKVHHLRNTIIYPSYKELIAIELPRYLFWGYYLIRPYRLIRRYLLLYFK